MAILFTILRDGNQFFASADGGPRFYVGRRVPYEGNIGLYNIFAGTKIERLNYSAADYTNAFGFWARFVEPTAACEGRNFLTLNTYDSAFFTFGFGQFAAHVPEGDFVIYFRTILGLPEAADYFPNLTLSGGHICNADSRSAPVPLEDKDSTARLMKYLNPDLSEVQDAEVINAAKLIHLTSKVPAARDAQVRIMTDAYREFMRRGDARVGLDGRTAAECCVVADLLHHGRGGRMLWPLVDAALKSRNPFESLIDIGAPRWKSRKDKLKAEIRARPDFATLRWNRAGGSFV
ncbi:hypothetical protein [Methylobacterium sp. R2-1]|uniref:hypothetical protein n=1 Tax=Methylobacterium sp. R2-1 TaxID=2587064 RepID=UPI00161E345B|nr:hypothetical protein [Methylobacterium sp. R2-1]MBB2960798.1 hypothetical protein [Methylobacterium sp. R2-1]